MKKQRMFYARSTIICFAQKIGLKMKLTLLLFLVGILNLVASESYSQLAKLTISLKDATVEQVLAEIKDNSEFDFVYNRDAIDLARKVDANYREAKVDNILDDLFKNTNVKYYIIDRVIVLSTVSGIVSSKAQPAKVSGKVTDSGGQPLPGVTVVVKGTTQGTVTNADGEYALSNISEGAILVFSFVGMRVEEIEVGNQTVIDIAMIADAIDLEEVVAVGYGTAKKVNLTGAVGVADSKRLENRAITSVGQGLQGVIPGLNITYGSGDPAESADFNIRGFESINGGEPLILVDGIPMDPNRVNPNDIESVSVLKDASAAAVYGARAAFGVVLITTKKGKMDQTTVNFSAQLTMNKPIYLGYEPIPREQAGTARQIMDNAYRALNNRELFKPELIAAAMAYQEMNNPTEQDAWYPQDGQLYYLGYIDAADKLIDNNVLQQKYDLSISGAGKKASYYVSMGTIDVPGFYKYGNEQFNRYNVLSKVDVNITDWLSVEEKISINTAVTNNPHLYSGYDGYRQVWAHPFFTPMEFPDLDYYLESGDREKYEPYIGMHNSYNDIIPYRKEGGRDITKQNDIWLTQGITLTPFKGLTIKGDFSYNFFWQHRENIHKEVTFVKGDFFAFNLLSPPYTDASWSYPSYMTVSEAGNHYYALNSYAEYVPENLENHYLKVMAGYNQEYGYLQDFYSRGNGIIHENVEVVGATSGTKEVGQTKNEIALRGIFYRLNYAYKDKYLFETSGRYDGTSRFPKNDRFGFFPSFSMGWRVSEESFMDWTNGWLDNLKVRASYGELGNQSVGNYYPYIASMNITNMPLFFDGSGNFPNRVLPPSLISGSLTWETVASKNIGIDFTMLGRRLDVSFDYFMRDTKDMLMRKTYPGILGADAPQENAADLRNEGWELAVTWADNIGKDWFYRVNLSLSDYQTTITKYDNPTGYIYDYYVGKKIGEIWGYKTIGLFQTEEELANAADQSRLGTANWALGDPHYADLNNDGEIYPGIKTLDDHGDLIRIGNTTPRYTFGINASLKYKSFTLDAFLQGIMKKDWYASRDGNDRFYPFNTYNMEQYWIDDTWTPDNTDAYFARRRFVSGGTAEAVYGPQTRYLQNAGYMRIKNLTLSYDLPVKFADMKVYVNGANLWEISGMYSLHDPEEPDNLSTPGYMFYRSYSLGLNITF